MKLGKGGTRVTATYRFAAPGGRLDPEDNGTYAIVWTDDAAPLSASAPAVTDPAPLATFVVESRQRGRLRVPGASLLADVHNDTGTGAASDLLELTRRSDEPTS